MENYVNFKTLAFLTPLKWNDFKCSCYNEQAWFSCPPVRNHSINLKCPRDPLIALAFYAWSCLVISQHTNKFHTHPPKLTTYLFTSVNRYLWCFFDCICSENFNVSVIQFKLRCLFGCVIWPFQAASVFIAFWQIYYSSVTKTVWLVSSYFSKYASYIPTTWPARDFSVGFKISNTQRGLFMRVLWC